MAYFISKRMAVALLIGVVFGAGVAQAASPAAELEEHFSAPPDSVKPWVYWFWIYNRVDKEGITRDLEEFHAKGIDTVVLYCAGCHGGKVRSPFGPDFLSPEWRELLRHAFKEAHRVNVKVAFNMCGACVMFGPWVTKDNAMKDVVQSKVILKGPQKFAGVLPQPKTVHDYYRDVSVQAFPLVDGNENLVRSAESLDLTDKLKPAGRLEWEVPEGRWLVLRTGYTLTGRHLTAEQDISPGSAGYDIDFMNADSLNDHFQHLGVEVLKEAGPLAGNTLAYLFTDSFEAGNLSWTQAFPANFRKYRGYDMMPYLPALSNVVVDNPEVTSRFKADFNRTIMDSVADNYLGAFTAACRKHGVTMVSEATSLFGDVPTDGMKNLGRCDIAAGEFWADTGFKRGAYNLNCKETASAIHTYGKKQALAEAFTTQNGDRAVHWTLGPSDLKPIGDIAFCEGINHFMLHQASCLRPKDGKPGFEAAAGTHFSPNITWWEQAGEFFRYIARCQYMLQEGKFVGDACFYLGDTASVTAPAKHYEPSLGLGYDCDYCNAEVLLTRMSVKDGRIVLPDGMSYRILALPEGDAMPPEVVRKIHELVQAGATVVGPKPKRSNSLTDYPQCDSEVKRMADELWADCDGQSVKEHKFGKGRIVWGKTLREVLLADGVKPDFLCGGRQSKKPVASWIWHAADGDVPPSAARTFQRKIFIPSNLRIVAANITLTVDDAFELRVNGTAVCSGNDWKKPVVADLTKYLVAGQNVLSVRAANRTGPAGLLVMGKITLDRGASIPIDSEGKSWTSSSDDKIWSPARVVSDYESSIWGDIGDFNSIATTLDFIHRKAGDADIYFVSNRKNQPVTRDCVFRVLGKQPEIWHPVSGEIRDAAAFRQADGCTELPLEFAPFESYFVVFRKSIDANVGGKSQRNFPKLSSVQEIAGPWTVKFDPKWGGPESVQFDKLTSWTARNEPGIKYYSGTAVYAKRFDLNAKALASGKKIVLDLGGLKNVATVRLNGKQLGVLWTAPWRVDATGAVKPKDNLLEIDVVNLWANRVIGDLNLPKEKRLTKTHDEFRFDFISKNTGLFDSGLLGPVVLKTAE